MHNYRPSNARKKIVLGVATAIALVGSIMTGIVVFADPSYVAVCSVDKSTCASAAPGTSEATDAGVAIIPLSDSSDIELTSHNAVGTTVVSIVGFFGAGDHFTPAVNQLDLRLELAKSESRLITLPGSPTSATAVLVKVRNLTDAELPVPLASTSPSPADAPRSTPSPEATTVEDDYSEPGQSVPTESTIIDAPVADGASTISLITEAAPMTEEEVHGAVADYLKAGRPPTSSPSSNGDAGPRADSPAVSTDVDTIVHDVIVALPTLPTPPSTDTRAQPPASTPSATPTTDPSATPATPTATSPSAPASEPSTVPTTSPATPTPAASDLPDAAPDPVEAEVPAPVETTHPVTTEPAPTPDPTPPASTPPTPPRNPNGALPTGATTGAPAGNSLKTVWGDITVAQAGTVLDGLDIHGRVKIAAANVTIKNSIIRGADSGSHNGLVDNMKGYTGLKILDTEIFAAVQSASVNGVMGYNFELRRVNIHHVIDQVHLIGGNVVIADSWLHDNLHYDKDPNWNGNPSHDDSIQIQEGSNISITNNSISGAKNSLMMITQDRGKVSNVTFARNRADGGACTINVAEKGRGPIVGLAITDNVFGRTTKVSNCAVIGPSTTAINLSGSTYLDGISVTVHKG